MTPTESLFARFVAGVRRSEVYLLGSVDAAWLSALRVVFGVLLAISMQRFIAHGWIDELLLRPSFRFKYFGFGWVEPLGDQAMHLLFPVLVALGLCVAAGALFRVTAPLLALGLSYIQLIDVSTYLNHYYLAALLAWLLALSPAGRAHSVDAWLLRRFGAGGARRAFGASERPEVSRIWLILFRAQVGLVYFFAGIAKLQPDWLLHGQPLRIWLGASTHLPVVGPLFTWEHTALVLSWCGFLFDTTICAWLSWSKSRPYAYAVVLVFHTFTRLLFDIGMFPLIMSSAALVFFSPAWPRRALVWLRRGARSPAPGAGVTRPLALRASALERVGLALAAGYLAVQVVLPLRTFLYEGNVLWHEQGMRLSWRVMVRAKGGQVTFIVRSKSTGREWHVSPSRYLTAFQENEMAGQPDLIVQLAHHIAKEAEDAGHGPVEVRVDSRVSLNGRRGAPLVDPALDLTTIDDGFATASYVLPAPESKPPTTRPVL